MTSFFSMLALVLGIGSGPHGLSEFLDAVDPKTYFEAKGFDYKVGEMIEIIETPAARKLDEEKPQEVRKLLAMRALGAMGDKSALPALQKVAASKHRFFSEQARAAIAQIEGNEYVRPSATAQQMGADLALLPKGLAVIFQVRLAAGRPADVKLAAKELANLGDGVADAAEAMKNFNRILIGFAEKIGNVRLDGMTIAICPDADEEGDFFQIAIARGLYDSKAVESTLFEIGGVKAVEVGGVSFAFHEGDSWAVAALSDELLVAVYSPGERPIFKEFAKRLKERPAKRELGPQLEKVVKRATPSRLWAAIIVPDMIKDEIPQAGAFDDVVMSSKLTADRKTLTLSFAASGQDAQAVTDVTAEMVAGYRMLLTEIQEEVEDEPELAGSLEFFQGIRSKVNGKTVTATFEVTRKSVRAAAAAIQLIDD